MYNKGHLRAYQFLAMRVTVTADKTKSLNMKAFAKLSNCFTANLPQPDSLDR